MADGLETRLCRAAAEAVRPGEHVLAAVSGGADSVALLRLLVRLRGEGRIRLSAAHFEHGIRGEGSRADMAFVQGLCRELDVALLCGAGDVPGEAKRRGAGIEETAREMRRAFLLESMRAAGADCIALAHHADDQAETVLMHILRGSGGRGAGGMRRRDGVWLRPLLHCRKSELIEYLARGGAAWREDPTNAQPFTPRNGLRLQVMPQMEAIFPGAVEALVRFADIQQAESDFLDGCARRWLRGNARTGPYGVRVALAALPDRAVLARAMKLLAGREAASSEVQRLCALCEKGAGRLEHTGSGRSAHAAAGELWLTQGAPEAQNVPICTPGETKLAEWGTLRTEAGEGRPVRGDPHRQELDALACEGARLRFWRQGDRMRPLGMGGRSRLLSDIYADRGVPPQKRRFMPVLEKDGEILWAVGACISETAKLNGENRALGLEWIPAKESPWENTRDDGGKNDAE
ncbi:MAG: tRNA lysidine(34) synthetase TilS [Eubacteriales bacterium]|nr:tRNA lysidine(34) synthetase TilS [Eubacteriales bacterium]